MNASSESSVRRTLRKGEKLRHRTLVEALFAHGSGIYEYPLRLKWRILSPDELQDSFLNELPPQMDKVQMMITVPKKKRRRAVDRVLLRRRIREAYRLNRLDMKNSVEQNAEIGALHLSFIFLGTENTDYAEIEAKMKRLLSKIEAKAKEFKS